MNKERRATLSASSLYWSTVLMVTLWVVLGLGGSKGQVRTMILASLISLGICGCDISLSSTMPWTSCVSSREPPVLPTNLIMSRLTSRRSKSAPARTALTATWQEHDQVPLKLRAYNAEYINIEK